MYLHALGYYTGSIDSQFGTGTKNAVIAFQAAYNLTQDGLVGAATKTKIVDFLINEFE